MSTQVGPGWKVEYWRSFKQLCAQMLLLDSDPNPMGGLMGYRPSSRFPDFEVARETLTSDPIFCWLRKNVPLAVSTTGDATPFVQIRRVRAVAASLVLSSGLPLEPIREDKQRKVAANAAERLLKSLDSGVLRLQNMAREEFFEELLEEAIDTLRSPQRKARVHKFPGIRSLASDLCQQTGHCDPKLLLEVAAALSLDCDERTAQNYAKEAKRAASAE
jgi:hypothetical protein